MAAAAKAALTQLARAAWLTANPFSTPLIV
jgi:hypothetical protein